MWSQLLHAFLAGYAAGTDRASEFDAARPDHEDLIVAAIRFAGTHDDLRMEPVGTVVDQVDEWYERRYGSGGEGNAP